MRKVFITGGSDGIGAELVRKFSSLGDKVVFAYQRSDSAAEEICRETGAYALKADLGLRDSAISAFEDALSYLGGIDILVNNVGISNIGLFTDMTDEEWERMLAVNLSSAIYISREASRVMIRSHSGRIINIGSVWGRVGASCEVGYSATKAAIRGFTMALAKELGPSGITVNCIEPGIIETRMNACFSDDEKIALAEETPLMRIGKPSDVAELAAFLAGVGASFITGQTIGVDGGFGL